MSKTKETHYPVEGRYLTDVPHVEHHDCTDASHVESGAFTTKKPKGEPAPETPEE